MTDRPIFLCQTCGEPMPNGEQMFRSHGYSGPCPKPPLTPQPRDAAEGAAKATACYEFPYQRTFDAIAAAIDCLKGPPNPQLSISVRKFQAAFNRHRDAKPLAPPKPAPATMRERFNYDIQSAPDAVREALEPFLTYLAQMRERFPESTSDTIIVGGPYNLTYAHFEKLRAAISAPVPPADGAMTPDFAQIADQIGDENPPMKWLIERLRGLATELLADPKTPWIGERNPKHHICWTAADRLAVLSTSGTGAAEPPRAAWAFMSQAEIDADKRVIGAEAAEPVAWRWRNPDDKSGTWRYVEKELREHPSLSLKVEPLYVAPPVRGDRAELIRVALKALDFNDLKFPAAPFRKDIEAIIDAILSIPVQPGAGERPSSETILARCDELHEIGFNDGWNGAVEECEKLVEETGLRNPTNIARDIRALSRQAPHSGDGEGR